MGTVLGCPLPTDTALVHQTRPIKTWIIELVVGEIDCSAASVGLKVIKDVGNEEQTCQVSPNISV